MTDEVRWHMRGHLLAACNCDWGCPCNFNARPTDGYCHGTYIWHIEDGRYGDIVLDGLYVAAATESPGPIHEGHMTAQAVVDERADTQQRDAIMTLLKGDAGGPFAIFASLIETGLRPIFAPFEASICGLNSRVNVPRRKINSRSLRFQQ